MGSPVVGSTGSSCLTNAFDTSFCGNCGKTDGTLLKCSACKKAFYCGKECQWKDWSKHKSVCKLMLILPFSACFMNRRDVERQIYLQITIDKLIRRRLQGDEDAAAIRKIGKELFEKEGTSILEEACEWILKQAPDGPTRVEYIKRTWEGIGDHGGG